MDIIAVHQIFEDYQRIMTQCRYLYKDEIVTANGVAIEAIEKQIPKQVENCNNQHNCPVCGDICKSYQRFCSECGQSLSWSPVYENH